MSDAPQTLELGAYKHVVVPIGVVIALGVARVVTSVSHYIQNRDRVRPAFAHVAWSTILFLWFVGLWWISWGLRNVEAELWSYFTLIFLLVGPSLMYLATTLLLPDVPEHGELDLGERFERIGRSFFACLAGLLLWLVSVELFLLQEALLLPKRVNQGILVALLGFGAIFPSRKTAGVLGALVLALAIVAFTTFRARLG